VPLRSATSAELFNPSLYTQPWTWTDDSGQPDLTLGLEGPTGIPVDGLQQLSQHVRNDLPYPGPSAVTSRSSWARGTDNRRFLRPEKRYACRLESISAAPESAAPELAFPQWRFTATRQLAKALGLGDFWSADRHVVHDFRIVLLDGDGPNQQNTGLGQLAGRGAAVNRSRNLRATIILQFAVIIAPLTALLSMQAALDARRASEASHSLSMLAGGTGRQRKLRQVPEGVATQWTAAR